MKLNVVSSSQPWYADGLKFSCTQCGNCCTGGPGYVWISDEELALLARHLGQSEQQTANKYCRKIAGRWSLKENKTPQGLYDCVFLKTIEVNGKPKRVCGVYEVRPLQCRTWPFWDANLSSEKAWKIAGQKCPGMDKGRKYSPEEIDRRKDATEWPTD